MQYIYKLPKAKLVELGLKPTQIFVLHDIYVLCKKDGTAKVSYDYLAKSNGLSVRAMKNIVKKLVEDKYITLKSGKYESAKKQEANQYRLTKKTKIAYTSSSAQSSLPSSDKSALKYPLKGVNIEIQKGNAVYDGVPYCEETYLKYLKDKYPETYAMRSAIQEYKRKNNK